MRRNKYPIWVVLTGEFPRPTPTEHLLMISHLQYKVVREREGWEKRFRKLMRARGLVRYWLLAEDLTCATLKENGKPERHVSLGYVLSAVEQSGGNGTESLQLVSTEPETT